MKEKNWKKAVSLSIRLVTALLRDVREGNLKVHAAGLAYSTIVTIVPLLAISFSVLKGLGIHNQVEPFLLGVLTPLGEQGKDVAGRIVSFVDNIKVGVLGSVGLALLIFGVMGMMRKIEAAFNDIWRVRRERTVMQRTRDYLSVIFIGPLFMSLSVAMTEVFRNKDFLMAKTGIVFPEALLSPVAAAIPYALFILAFTALYMFMPNTQVKLIPAVIAGAVAAAMWKVMGKLFGLFVVSAGSYAAIYSAFAALMLLMIWIYVGWLIVLIGASMAYYIQNPSNQKMPRYFRALSARVREKAALLACREIGRVFYAGGEPLTLHTIATRVNLPSVIAGDIVEALCKANILAVTGKTFIPACPFDETTVDEVFARLRAVEEGEGFGFAGMKAVDSIDALLAAAEAQARRELEKKTLKQLCAG